MVNSIIDAKTPKVVLAVNQSSGTLRIPKNTYAGTIGESMDSGYFSTSWTKACKAIAAAWMVGSAANLNGASATEFAPGTDLSYSVMTSLAIGAEFPLTNLVRSVADGSYFPSVAAA